MKRLLEFESTLRGLARSAYRAGDPKAKPPLLNATFACPATEPLVLFDRAADPQRILWEQPDRDFALLAIGSVALTTATGPDRLAQLRTGWQQDSVAAISTPPTGETPVFPIALAALPFSPTARQGSEAPPPEGFLLIPRLLFLRDGDQFVVNVTLAFSDDLDSAIEMTRRELELLLSPSDADCKTLPTSTQIELTENVDFSAWEGQVRLALGAIDTGQLEKVVLARTLSAISETPFALGPVLKTLEQRYPHCTVFAYGSKDGCFVGATPERLLRLQDGRVQVDCLAGSIPIGDTRENSETLAQTILKDAKELHEHAIVVRMVRDLLEPLCESIDAPSQPLILRTADLQHLHTPLSAVAKRGSDIFDFVQQLHPTPATGGSPRKPALSFIEATETSGRGWYAGPCGWIDAKGNGEISVAIRSAFIKENQATLYAGCGIVAGSDPSREYEETALKLRTMLWALQEE